MSQKHVYLIYLITLTVIPGSCTDGARQLVTIGNDPSSPEYSHGVVIPPVFRPGSGAVVAPATTDSLSGSSKQRTLTFETLKYFTLFGAAIAAVLITLMMMPGGFRGNSSRGGNRDYHYRVPPSWSPESESQYPFRAYMTDVSLMMMLTDLQPH